jgi:hypothetical protein
VVRLVGQLGRRPLRRELLGGGSCDRQHEIGVYLGCGSVLKLRDRAGV